MVEGADLLCEVGRMCIKAVVLQVWVAASPSQRVLLKVQILRPQPYRISNPGDGPMVCGSVF